jgi:hypothetical protein
MLDTPKDEKNISVDAPVLSASQDVVDTTRAEADMELAQTHEGEFGTKRDLVSVIWLDVIDCCRGCTGCSAQLACHIALLLVKMRMRDRRCL